MVIRYPHPRPTRRALVRFGILSAAGGLLGALINAPILSVVLGPLLIFADLSGFLGLAERMRLGRRGKRGYETATFCALTYWKAKGYKTGVPKKAPVGTIKPN